MQKQSEQYNFTVTLDRKDLINLVRGTYPYYENTLKFFNLGLGHYSGRNWYWKEATDKCWESVDDKELYIMYFYELKR